MKRGVRFQLADFLSVRGKASLRRTDAWLEQLDSKEPEIHVLSSLADRVAWDEYRRSVG